MSELLAHSRCTKSRWQLRWAFEHGKSVEEAFAPQRCDEREYKNWHVDKLSHTLKGKLYWHVCCKNCNIKAIKTSSRVNLDLKCSNCNMRPKGESGLKLLMASYKWAATKRSLSFSLSAEEFRTLTSGNCYYCGIEPVRMVRPRKVTGGTDWGDYKYNGVDRKDNSKGYDLNNCVSCCKTCNIAKSDMTFDEFIDYLFRITENFKTKK